MTATAAGEDQKPPKQPPVMIKLLGQRRDAEDKQDRMNQAALDYGSARGHVRAMNGIESQATPAEREAAQRELTAAGQAMSRATIDWAQAENARRRLEAEAQSQGLNVPSADGAAPGEKPNPLGPSLPLHHDIQGGKIFEYLRDKLEPDNRGDAFTAGKTHFDGAGRGLPLGDLLTRLEETRFFLVQEAERKRAVAEAALREGRERKAREAEDDRQRQVAAYVSRLVEAANNHIESAANVDTSDPAAVKAYNDRTDYFINEYKKWTGKDLTYKYKAQP